MKQTFLLILATALIFVTQEPVSKMLSGQVNPLSLTCLRFFIGGLILLPFALRELKVKRQKLQKRDIIRLVILGIICICISKTLQQVSVFKANSAAVAAIVFSVNSVFTMILAVFFLKEKLTWKKLLALVICIAGVLLSTDFSSGENTIGILLAVVAASFFSIYTIMGKKMMARCSSLVQTSFAFLFGSIALFFILCVSGINILAGINITNIWILLYLGIIGTGIGYYLYFAAVERSVLSASFVFFIKPALAPFAAWLLLGDMPSIWVFATLLLVLLGSYLSLPGKKKKASQEASLKNSY